MEERKTGYSQDDADELKAFFKKNDITRFATLDKEYMLSGKKSDIYAKAKKYLSEKWDANLPELGIKRNMKNYSAVYPVNLLKDTDASYFAEQVADIFSDEKKYRNAIDTFFAIYEEPLSAGFEAYAAKENKSVEELTDDEIRYIIDQIADTIDGELTNVTMIGQKVPEVYGVSKAIRTHEDFNGAPQKNYDLINFHNKWTHCKTKLGAPLLFSELPKEEMTGIEGARSFFESADAHTQKEYEEIRDAFANTLNSTDREIYYMREQGYTQAEIAERLGYKTHSAVTKRMRAIHDKLDVFLGNVEDKHR